MAKDRSKLDEVQQDRDSFEASERAKSSIKVNNLVPRRFSRIDFVYDCCCNFTKLCYFDEPVVEINTIKVIADCCSNLAGDNFLLRSAKNAGLFSISYQVCGVPACPPCVACATDIVVSLCSCDPAPVVALATSVAIAANCNFGATANSCNLTITNTVLGIATAAIVCCGLVGFIFCHVTENCNRLISTLCFTYDCDCNITRANRSFVYCKCCPSGA